MGFAGNSIKKHMRTPAVRVATPLALDNGITAKIISFDKLCDDKEHVALVFPLKDKNKTPIVRLHSECLTGDVFGSAHCDCGNQLAEAKKLIGEEGGILIYLRQEGRGIGLYNKIEAYKIQHDKGLDTFEANRHIGFEDDPRNFKVAAEMLHALGVAKVRLLTNNPEKVAGLEEHGVKVEEVIPTGRFEKSSNKHYLEAKRKKGHRI